MTWKEGRAMTVIARDPHTLRLDSVKKNRKTNFFVGWKINT